MTSLKLVDLDIDVFDERPAVVKAQIMEAEYWLKCFERVRKLMNSSDRENYDSVTVELLERDE